MRGRSPWILLVGLAGGLAIGALGNRGSSWLTLAGPFGAAVLVWFVGWLVSRGMLRSRYTADQHQVWTNLPPPWKAAGLDEPVEQYESELKSLGYRRIGYLGYTAEENGMWTVYHHRDHPTYALLTAETARGGRAVTLSLETFWENGGHLTTSSASAPRFEAGLEDRGLRLVQQRIGGTAKALDGQHVGTLRAWEGGGRKPLPATREALPGYLAAVHERLREHGEQRGWLPLGVYTRVLFQRPPGTLRF